MSASKISLLVAFAACFGSFIWAMQGGFFKVVGHVPKGVRAIQAIGSVLMIAHLLALILADRKCPWTAATALGLYAVSLAFFWSAIWVNQHKPLSLAFSTDQPEHLVQRGPYRFIRHPFYASYTVAWVAGVVGSEQLWLLSTVIAMLVVYYRAAAMEERKFLSGPFAGEYTEYRKRTGMFIPKIVRKPRGA